MQFVFYTCAAEVFHIFFNGFYGLLHLKFSISHRGACSFVPHFKLLISFLSQNFLTNNKRPQALHSQLFTTLNQCSPLHRFDLLLHDSLRSLQIEHDLTRLSMSHYDTHTLRLTTKWKIAQNVVFLRFTCCIMDFDVDFLSLNKVHTE